MSNDHLNPGDQRLGEKGQVALVIGPLESPNVCHQNPDWLVFLIVGLDMTTLY